MHEHEWSCAVALPGSSFPPGDNICSIVFTQIKQMHTIEVANKKGLTSFFWSEILNLWNAKSHKFPLISYLNNLVKLSCRKGVSNNCTRFLHKYFILFFGFKYFCFHSHFWWFHDNPSTAFKPIYSWRLSLKQILASVHRTKYIHNMCCKIQVLNFFKS